MATKQYLADFLRSHEVELHNADVDALYNELDFYDRKDLTALFMEMGVNPLLYLTFVPKCYASSLDAPNTTFGRNVSKIGAKAFANCSGIYKIVIPEGVTAIGVLSFGRCPDLEEITLPKSLQVIHKRAFEKCPLQTIEYKGTISEWENLSKFGAFSEDLIGTTIVACSDGDTTL